MIDESVVMARAGMGGPSLVNRPTSSPAKCVGGRAAVAEHQHLAPGTHPFRDSVGQGDEVGRALGEEPAFGLEALRDDRFDPLS